MKKLFLTSGIIACMACPALAEGTGFSPSTVGRDGNNNNVYPIGENTGATIAELSNSVVNNGCVTEAIGTTQGASTLIANWTPNQYTITYVAPTSWSGTYPVSGSTSTQQVTWETTPITLEANNHFTATGYHFTGWSAPHDIPSGDSSNATTYGTAVSGQPNADYTLSTIQNYRLTDDITLTATFAPNVYSVTYNKNNHGSYISGNDATTFGAGSANGGVTFDATWTSKTLAEANITENAGYTFRGWSEDANAVYLTDTLISAGQAQSAWHPSTPGDVTLYAIYSADTFTITYSCTAPQGASQTATTAETHTQSVTYDGSVTLLAGNTVCTLPGYTFTGWSCDNFTTGSGTQTYGTEANNGAVSSGQYKIDGNATCSAVWRQNRIGLTWTDGAHSGNSSATGITGGASQCTYDSTIQLPTINNVPGYTFAGFTVSSVDTTATEPQAQP